MASVVGLVSAVADNAIIVLLFDEIGIDIEESLVFNLLPLFLLFHLLLLLLGLALDIPFGHRGFLSVDEDALL